MAMSGPIAMRCRLYKTQNSQGETNQKNRPNLYSTLRICDKTRTNFVRKSKKGRLLILLYDCDLQQDSLVEKSHIGTLTLVCQTLVRNFPIFLDESRLTQLLLRLSSAFLVHVRNLKRATSFQIGHPENSKAEESKNYVGTNGFSKIMRMHLRRCADWRRCGSCNRSASCSLYKEG